MRSAIARTSEGAPVRTVPSGTAIRRPSSEIATPILASPRSSPRTLPGSATCLQEFLQAWLDGVERLLEGVPLRASGEREVGLAPLTPAHDLRRRFEQRRRVHAPGDQALRARRHQQGLATRPGPEHHGRAVRTLEAIRHVLAELALELLHAFGVVAGTFERSLGVGTELSSDRVQEVAFHVDLAQGVGPDEGLDAAHAGADRCLVDDADERDFARVVDVRASAELDR